jgi:phosphoribosylformylglycinamidine cyclo-ligase
MGVKIELGSWKVLPIFQLIQKYGQVAEEEMFATFNMGIGMILAVNQETASKVMADLENQGEEAYIIGSVGADQPGVTLWRP